MGQIYYHSSASLLIVVNLVEADRKTLHVCMVFIKGLVSLGILNE